MQPACMADRRCHRGFMRSSQSSVFAIAPMVHVVDDNRVVQESVQLLLHTVGLHAQVYPSAQDFLGVYNDNMAGCLLLDVRMPGMSGLELQRTLNERHCILPVVFMTGHGDVQMAVAAMQSGAVDFIMKPFNDQELLERVGKAMHRDEQQRLVLKERHEIKRRLISLSEREREIMDMVVDGKANKVIAADLDLSQRTVEIHRARVMEKMQATSLAQLVRMVIAADELDSEAGVTQLTRA
jgi:two-component system, LuxR family, response regulator FixJ